MTICNRLKLAKKWKLGSSVLKKLNRILSEFLQEPHELMRATEVSFIRDCAEMAARASLFREESRWGLYHYRADSLKKITRIGSVTRI